MKWYWQAFKKYATFTGRARRSEFWFFFLFQFILQFAMFFIIGLSSTIIDSFDWANLVIGILGVGYLLVTLATLLPSIAVAVRRLHDVGLSGWWVPVVPSVFWGGVGSIASFDNDEMIGLMFIFVFLFSIVFSIFLFAKLISDGEKVTNRYGINPKENDNIASFFE